MTGEGLPELLDEIGRSEGIHGVVEFLRHLNIRYHDGGEGAPRLRPFRVVPRDPFVDDHVPDWLLGLRRSTDTLEETIYDFVDRHERGRLRKHAVRGNVNGMRNFVDIFTALTHLLHAYHQRGIVKGGKLIAKVCRLIEVATTGRCIDDDQFPGYLESTLSHLARDSRSLQEVCDETEFLAELRAAQVIAQDVRSRKEEPGKIPGRSPRPREMLVQWAKQVDGAIRNGDLREPDLEAVGRALSRYRSLQKDEIARLLREMPD